MEYYYRDFTEANYMRLMELAKSKYEFIKVADYRRDRARKVIINRHDLDSSLHRAEKLSAIEKEVGVTSAYFVYLHSPFYSVFEKGAIGLIQRIAGNGHEVGLHFEPWFYGIEQGMRKELESCLEFEKGVLETLSGLKVSAFSFHNPDRGGWASFPDDTVCGLINMYGGYFKDSYGYCSDSDGHWRYRRLEDVLDKAEEERLQVLTHPEWWTPEVMRPRERIMRCAEGRLGSCMRQYDETMSAMGRTNEK